MPQPGLPPGKDVNRVLNVPLEDMYGGVTSKLMLKKTIILPKVSRQRRERQRRQDVRGMRRPRHQGQLAAARPHAAAGPAGLPEMRRRGGGFQRP
ncbi:MAG: hypothetical protein BJ554DRAFT_8102 [Olpidium bornovanus]|uniref:Uncharacterized protein n=1 Tax=Olpidium bornovanus TaxID=278681 RepID=A0A8H7ZVH7_9FUNG|nr:MAG: hypothetical protein BJ554DRAFT_8102 [Olpidium bornovanus]